MPGRPPILEVLQPDDGGVAEHVLRLSLGLRERGWPVEVAASPRSSVAGDLRAAGVPVHNLPLRRWPGRDDLAAVRALRALDRRGGYGLIHGHSSKAGALVRVALPDRRRLIYTPHCFAFAASFSRAEQLAYRTVEQALLPRSAAVVAVCDWERRLAERCLMGARGALRVVPNGVPDVSGGAPHAALREFAGGHPLAALVSVLRPQKDPLLAVRAGGLLAGGGDPPGRLAIVGNGPLEAQVQREIARLGAGEWVRWFPFEGDVRPYLAASDVFLSTSAWEALPLAVLEAMSCSLPVLATSVGGVPEAVEDGVGGRLVPPGDAPALASALRELLADGEARSALGAGGRRAFERRFTVERMVDELAGLYTDLLGRSDAGSRSEPGIR